MQARSRKIKPDFFFSTEKKTPSKQGGYYYPFGMTINERSWNADSYDYGFQGQLKDDEVKGSGNSIEFKYRIHDPRLGRFLSIDPLFRNYPGNSTYAFSHNRPIDGVDLEGLEWSSCLKAIFKWSGFSPLDEAKTVEQTHTLVNEASRYGGDVVPIVTGVVIIVGSGGTATPFVLASGVAVTGGGLVKLGLDIAGEHETADKVPTTVTGTVLTTISYLVDGEMVSEDVLATVEFVEGVITFNFSDFTKFSKLKDAEKAIVAMESLSISIDLSSIVNSNLFSVLSNSVDKQELIPNSDNARVDPPVVSPIPIEPIGNASDSLQPYEETEETGTGSESSSSDNTGVTPQ